MNSELLLIFLLAFFKVITASFIKLRPDYINDYSIGSYHPNKINNDLYVARFSCRYPCEPDEYYRYIKNNPYFTKKYSHSYPSYYDQYLYEPINPYFGSSVHGIPIYIYYPERYDHHYKWHPTRKSKIMPNKVAEPRYFGKGEVFIKQNIAELVCNFDDPTVKIISNVAWVKVTSPFRQNYSGQIPPFDCYDCSYSHINTYDDIRYRVLTKGSVSILQICDYQPSDCGLYRCTVTGLSNDLQTQTLYQVIEFFN